ncbi:ABC-F family ATP-binding cassette domain-containing protein [Aliihoeflea sp. PC F10.4]
MLSLSVHDLSFRLPDGRTLFENLDLSFSTERIGLVGRNGAGKSSLLAILAGYAAPSSGAVSRDGVVRMLSQRVGEKDATLVSLFGIAEQLAAIERAEMGEAGMDELTGIDWKLPARLEAALVRFGISGIDPSTPLDEFSGGQRTRAGLAALVFDRPDFILLDEPTNNLDAEGRRLVLDLLDSWRGGAVVVSHDRELLRRMDRIVELSPLGARVYGGNYDDYHAAREAERAVAETDLKSAEQEMRRVERKAQQMRERQERRDAGGRRSRAGSSDPKILLDARKERAEGTAGRGGRLGDRLKAKSAESLSEARSRIERTTPFAAGMAKSAVHRGRVLLTLDDVAAGFGDVPVIHDIGLSIVGPERIALTGPNGAGKSTLLAVIAGDLEPMCGTVHRLGRMVILDQHVSILDPSLSILDNFARLNPDATSHDARSALARYAFRADDALKRVANLSGGELLRSGLACSAGGAAAPELLILDEPTNHLDLDSIAAVEDGLQGFAGALLVVSHDRSFLDAIGVDREFVLEHGCLRH